MHYETGDHEFRLKAPFAWFVPSRPSGIIFPSSLDDAAITLLTPSESLKHRIAQYLWRLLLRLLGGGEILYVIGPSPQLLEWVRKFQPEVIYGHFSSLNSLRFLHRLQETLGIPLVLHFMDDFPQALYQNNVAHRYLRPLYLREFVKLVHSADVAIAISQEMAEEYQKRYQRNVISLPMPVEIDAYRNRVRTQWTTMGEPFRIRYGGRVGWAIRESLADLAKAIQFLRHEGANVEFDLATFQAEQLPSACLELSGVNVRIPGRLADLPRLQAEADLLVICYDFDSDSFREARYSMPSKMGDCMASGTPILVYGPAGLPVVEYARRDGWGKVVDSREPSALQCAIYELMGSASLREKLGKKAMRLAADSHCALKVSERFRRILHSAIDVNSKITNY
ncbi:MAG: glycosyltransferase [Chlorobiaceae bacterium]